MEKGVSLFWGDTPFGFAGGRAAHRGRNGLPEPGRLPFAGRAALFHRPDTHLGHAFQLPYETVDVGLFLDFAVVVGVEYRRPDRLDGFEAWSTVIV